MAAEPSSVALARSEIMRWFHDLGRRDDRLAASIALAVSEAVGNVVRHAYPGDASGRVEIEAETRDGGIVVDVSDGGTGLEGTSAQKGMGLGFSVIGRMADGVTVSSEPGRTRVSMRFEFEERPAGRNAFLRRASKAPYALAMR